MTTITINLKSDNPAEVAQSRLAIQKIVDNTSFSNLKFLARLSQKPDINKKLEDPLNRAALEIKL